MALPGDATRTHMKLFPSFVRKLLDLLSFSPHRRCSAMVESNISSLSTLCLLFGPLPTVCPVPNLELPCYPFAETGRQMFVQKQLFVVGDHTKRCDSLRI